VNETKKALPVTARGAGSAIDLAAYQKDLEDEIYFLRELHEGIKSCVAVIGSPIYKPSAPVDGEDNDASELTLVGD